MKQCICLLLTVMMVTIANAQVRQSSNTGGLNLAAQVHALGWSSEYFQFLDENAGSGYGGGVRIGYGITQLFEPYLGVDFTKMGLSDVDAKSFSMTHVDLGLRLNFAGTTHPVRPFVEGGYSFRKGTVKEVINGNSYIDLKFSGGTPHVGGGLHYFLKVPVSIFARGIFTVGKSSNVYLNNEKTSDKSDITTFRVGVGVNFNLTELLQPK